MYYEWSEPIRSVEEVITDERLYYKRATSRARAMCYSLLATDARAHNALLATDACA